MGERPRPLARASQLQARLPWEPRRQAHRSLGRRLLALGQMLPEGEEVCVFQSQAYVRLVDTQQRGAD